MKNPTYWKNHYVLETDANEIERHIRMIGFVSAEKRFEMPCFIWDKAAPNILISMGSGGHPFVFAELAYWMHMRGYNVFIMPRHGGSTVNALIERHGNARQQISNNFNDRIGIFGEGLGGYVVFYLGLVHTSVKSIFCQNSPGILTEKEYHDALLSENGLWTAMARRRKIILPLANLLVRVLPNLPLPISSYLDWKAIIDPRPGNRELETRLVVQGYLQDPDFDKWYPLSAVMSLVSTPPPNPVEQLETSTMFAITCLGPTPIYIKNLYERLPTIKKRMVEIDGSVYWMLSHPRLEAKLVCDWFDETV